MSSSKKTSVSVTLDSYDDIFSDFDSRSYEERSLSDDFIAEAKKMAKENPEGKVELFLLVPHSRRHQELEPIIIENLHLHFWHFAHTIENEMKRERRRGMVMSAVGFLLMSTAAFVISISDGKFYWNIVRIILEPAGWFLVWIGLEEIYYGPRKKSAELEFNLKMAQAEIAFLSR